MKLNNLKTRKEFILNEDIAGGKGGVGGTPGFANNLLLQDTYLGILLDGMFRGISRLWRKSKENFVINKLLARLTNELLRGVILYCFANNINIGSAQAEAQAEAQTGDEQGEGQAEAQTGEEDQEDQTKKGIALGQGKPEEEQQPKKALEPGKKPEEPKKVSKEEYIETGGNFIAALNKFKTDETIDKKKQNLETGIKRNDAEVVKKYLVDLFMTIESDEVKKRILLNMSEEQRNNLLSYLPEEERSKYNFGDQVQDAQYVQVTDDEKTKGLPSGKSPKALSPHVNEFQAIKNDITEDLVNPTRETIKKVFGFPFDPNRVANIKNIEQYEQVVTNLYTYLKNNIDKYSKLKNVAQKEKMKLLYMNYEISKNILSKIKQKQQAANESLNEDFVTAKPISDPRAGADPSAKKISTNVTVGQLLTKRDREKYKEHADEMKLNLNDLNLAKIEKEVEKRKAQDEVSKFVNPENLKTIQLTADQLFLPHRPGLYKKAEVGEKSVEKQKLQNNWNKELSKVYASFSNLMTVSNVDIRKDYMNNLNNDPKINKNAKNDAEKFGKEKKIATVYNELENKDILEKKQVTITDLKKGQFGFISFIGYNSNKSKSDIFFAVINKVIRIGSNYDLLRVATTFREVDVENGVYENNFDVFKKYYTYDGGDKDHIEYYILSKNLNIGRDKNRTNYIVILNYNTTTKELSVLKKDQGDTVILPVKITDSIEKKERYSFKIETYEFKLIDNEVLSRLGLDEKFGINLIKDDYRSKNPDFYNKDKSLFNDFTTKIF